MNQIYTSFLLLFFQVAFINMGFGQCDKIYNGSITLRTQAAVNAFAAEGYCEVTGFLIIGESNSDVTSLAGLNTIIAVGYLDIINNPNLSSLVGLDNISSTGQLRIFNNPALNALSGLGSMVSIENSLFIKGNAALSSLAGLDNITSIGNIFLETNAALNSLAALGNLTSVASLSIYNNDALSSLFGLHNIISVSNTLTISKNASLNALSSLENITSIMFDLTIEDNPTLTSCCAIQKRLVTGVGRTINIQNNNTDCDSAIEIINVCTNNCRDVEVVGTTSAFTVSTIPSNTKLDYLGPATGYGLVPICEGNCESSKTISGLTAGEYTIKAQTFNPYCYAEYKVMVTEENSLPDLSLANIQNFPSTAQQGSVATFNFDLNNFGNATATGAYKIKIFLTKNRGISQFDPLVGEIITGNTPFGTTANVTAAITIPLNQNEGEYYLSLRVDVDGNIAEADEFNNFLASTQTLAVTGGTGGQTEQCGEIRIDYSPRTITMKGQSNKNYFFKIHDLNADWAEVYSCSYNCGSSQTATALANGKYIVRVYNTSWNLICEQAIDLIGGGSACENVGDNDGDGLCNDKDNCPDTFNPDQVDSDGNGVGDVCDIATGACSFQTTFNYRAEFFNPSFSMVASNSTNYTFNIQDFGKGSERITLDLDGNITNTQFIPANQGACGGKSFCFDTQRFHKEKSVDVTKKGDNGTIVWTKSYSINHPTDILGIPYAPAIKVVGNELLFNVDFFAENGWFTVFFKLDNDGNEIWQNKLPKHTFQSNLSFFSTARDGGYYFTNRVNSSIDIIKIDANGNKQWTAQTTGDLVSNDVYVLGETPDATGFYYGMYRSNLPIVVRLNNSNGQKIWEQRLSDLFSPNRGLVFGFLRGATITKDGGIVAGYGWDDPGAAPGQVRRGYEYGKLDGNGNLVWWHDLPTSITDNYGSPIASFATDDGGYIFRSFDTNAKQLFLLKVTNQGTLTPECSGNTGGNNTIQCGEIKISYTSNSIAMNGQNDKNYNYKIHDLNNDWAEVFSCTYQCGNSQTANNLSNGRYLVKIFDEGWSLICEQEINVGANSRNRFTDLETFTVYPNPAQEELYISLKEFSGAQGEVAISNIYGQIIHQQTVESVSGDALRLSLTDFVNGVYFVHIKMPNRQLRSEKFLVERLY